MKHIYVCCNAENKGKYKEMAKAVFADAVEVVETMEQADVIYVMEADKNTACSEVEHAITCGKYFVIAKDKFIPTQLYESVLNNQMEWRNEREA